MSRNVYRLCNTSHIQSKPANSKILQTIAYWVGQLLAKPRLTMVCVTPAISQHQQPFIGNKTASVNHSSLATQKTQTIHPENALAQTQVQAQDHNDHSDHSLNSNQNQSSISSTVSSLARAGKKANMLFLKVYSGPIFQDKKVDQTAKIQVQATALTSQTSQLVKDPFCLPNQGLYPACLQMLNAPTTGKKPVFISGKMSDIFAQLDQLAA